MPTKYKYTYWLWDYLLVYSEIPINADCENIKWQVVTAKHQIEMWDNWVKYIIITSDHKMKLYPGDSEHFRTIYKKIHSDSDKYKEVDFNG